ncbi:NACHT domain-containing protein [Saccharopolyspora taberi]
MTGSGDGGEAVQGRYDSSSARPEVHNAVGGKVHGPVVQAGRIEGGVHQHYTVGWQWWAGAVVVWLILLACLLLVVLSGERAPGWWQVVLLAGPVFTVGLPAFWWLFRRARRAGFQGRVPEEALSSLRSQVRRQWLDELGRRRLQQPRPLRLRWRPTSRRVRVAASDGDAGLAFQRGELVQDTGDRRPAAHALVEAFRRTEGEQLVVLGEPGAGKSTLALLFTLAFIEKLESSAPVPVLLTAADWNSREPVEKWIARRISEDYPVLSRRQARLLLDEGRILPVLDGLDEIHAQRLDEALPDLDRSAATGLQMVITCRSNEFERAVRKNGALSHAAVVEIDPIDVDSAKIYLEQAEIEDSNRWASVITAMENDPDGNTASLLSTPLMLSLARRVYRRTESRPQRLTEFATLAAAERHLLDELIPSTYEDEREWKQARRWLVFLSHHLHDRIRTTNFEWWQLARAVPRWVIALLAAVLTGVAATPVLVLGIVTDLGYQIEFPVLLVTCLAVAGMIGLNLGRSAYAVGPSERPVRAVLGGVLRDLAAFVTAFCVIATGALLISYTADPQAAEGTVVSLAVSWQTRQLRDALVVVGAVVLAVSLIANVLWVRHGGMPQRSTPRLRTLIPNLVVGAAVGAVVVISFVFVIEATSGAVRGSGSEPEGVGVISGVFALLIGLPLGVARWVTTPDVQHAARSPRTVLGKDRAALFGAVGASSAPILAVSVLASVSSEEGLQWPDVLFPLGIGYVVAAVVLFGSGNAWMSYTIARLWLAAWGCLPWRLFRFLGRAHEAELLRQVGAVYQFRHDRLRTHLAERGAEGKVLPRFALTANSRGAPGSTALQRTSWRGVVSTALGIGVLAGTLTFLYPPHGPQTVAAFTLYDVGVLDKAASSRDGGTVVIAGDATAVLSEGRVTRLLPVASGEFLSLSPNGDLLAVLGYAGAPQLELWNTRTGQRLHTPGLLNYPGNIRGIGFSQDGEVLAIRDEERGVALWNVHTDQPVQVLPHSAPPVSTDEFDEESWSWFSPDLRTIATITTRYGGDTEAGGSTLQIRDVHTGTLTRTVPDVECIPESPMPCGLAVFSENRVRLARAGADEVQELGGDQTPRNTKVLGVPGEYSAVAFSQDGRTLVGVYSFTGGSHSTGDGPMMTDLVLQTWDVRG